jgi:flavin-dependent dehydrogenase
MKPISIIGGGLAGLSLGISLRRHDVPVTIHEAGTYPRHRVCGEFINGVSDATLKQLGIEQTLGDARMLSTTAWHLNDRLLFKDALPVPARGISRFALDQRLAQRFQDLGGDLRTESRARRTAAEGQIWAAGRTPDPTSQWIGLKVHVFDLPLQADLEMHLGSGGYVGLAPVEGKRVNVCGLFARRVGTGRGALLLHDYLIANGLDALGQRLAEVEHDAESFTGVSAFTLGARRVDEAACVLGDSESMIPPFTGNGMSMAFESAEIASAVLLDYAEEKCRWPSVVTEVRRRLTEQFRIRLFTARVLHPFLLGDAGRTLFAILSKCGLLPFGSLSRLLR